MKAHQFISALDEARYGRRRVTEDKDAVASSPDHAPTSTAQWKTKSTGKSEDEGERTGNEKNAIKKSDASIPAPVAKEPSHAPTSTAQWKTKDGKSEDEGEKISKEAMKENLIRQLIDDDEVDIEAVMAASELNERGGHKAGCGCGFCKNKGSFGKKKQDAGDDEGKDKGKDKDSMSEDIPSRRLGGGRVGFGVPAKMGSPIKGKFGAPQRLGFRHPSAARPRPKSNMGPAAPYQPSMEHLDKAGAKGIQQVADGILEAPE